MRTEIDYIMRDLINEGRTNIKGRGHNRTIIRVTWKLSDGVVMCDGHSGIPLYEPGSHKALDVALGYCSKHEECSGCPFWMAVYGND